MFLVNLYQALIVSKIYQADFVNNYIISKYTLNATFFELNKIIDIMY